MSTLLCLYLQLIIYVSHMRLHTQNYIPALLEAFVFRSALSGSKTNYRETMLL